ncbi:MAG: hypothetical protein AAFZ65_10870 [Planctomycetota bacterium]
MSRSHRVLVLFVAWACALLVAPADARSQETEPVGELGFELELGSNWVRSSVSLEVSEDEFAGRDELRGCFLALLEFPSAVYGVEDVARHADRFSLLAQAAVDDVETRPGKEIETDDRVVAIRSFGSTDFGPELHFVHAAVGAQGTMWVLTLWGPAKSRQRLAREAKRLALDAVLPGPDSPLASLPRTRLQSLDLGGTRIGFTLEGTFWSPLDVEDDELLSWEAGLFDAELYLLEGFGFNATEALAGPIGVFREQYSHPEIVDRFSTQVGGRDARAAVLYSPVRNETAHLWAVPLDDGSFLDLRLLVYGPPDALEPLREDLLESFTCEPIVPDPSSPAYVPAWRLASEAEQRFADAGTVVGRVTANLLGCAPGLGGWVAWTEDTVWSYDPSFAEGEPIWGDGWITDVGAGPNEVHVQLEDGSVVLVRPNASTRRAARAPRGERRVETLPDGRLVRLERELPRTLPGVPVDPDGALATLSIGDDEVWSGRLGRLGGLKLSGDRTHLLVVSSLTAPVGEGPQLDLHVYDLADRSMRRIDGWHGFDEMARGRKGWLVNGAPTSLNWGLWELEPGGELRRWTSNAELDVIGYDDQGRLLLATGFEANPEAFITVRAYDPAAVAALGPVGDWLRDDTVLEVLRAVESEIPATVAESEALLRAAEAVEGAWERELGWPCPTDPEGVRRFSLAALRASHRAPAAAGLARLLWASSKVRAGAVVVGTIDLNATPADPTHQSSPFAVAFDPAHLEHLLYDESPADRVAGRTLLIGPPSPERDEAFAAAGSDLTGVAGRDLKDLQALAERHPDNRYLRGLLARRLLNANRRRHAVDLLRPWALADDPAIEDLKAYYGLLTLPDERPLPGTGDLVEALTQLAADHPSDLDLFTLLARAHQLRGGADDLEQAITLFRLVYEHSRLDSAAEAAAYQALLDLDAEF